MLANGLYEQIINKALESELATTEKHSQISPIDSGESAKILSRYLCNILENKLLEISESSDTNGLKDKEQKRVSDQVAYLNRIISFIGNETDCMQVSEKVDRLLLALIDKKNNIFAINDKAEIIRPETSIAQSSLFTGAIHEPQMYTELKKEIVSCDRIYMLVSFIKWSGLRLIIDELSEFTQNGGILRIITTSYMGATDIKAIEELCKLANTTIKVSYDTKHTRLHAKSYVFYRNTGFTTAYVGSSNLSNAAISSGLEWNIKVTKKDLPETIDKIIATFESYWNSNEFEYYEESQQGRLSQALKSEKFYDINHPAMYTMDILPYSYQQEILDKLDAERIIRGYSYNLVVAATGTGKTVISAFDYKRFCKSNIGMSCRLLFVAHREEILKQSLYTFRAVLKDPNFGELFVGSYNPDSIDHLFMSIQTFNSQSFTEKTSPDYYDYIVVDEFHHAAAPTYHKLLSYYQPKILLGLTATPERMDGKSILPYFNNRIAAEIRLPEAINRKLLCPFQYFGVTDTVDLDQLKWTNGGYDKAELSKIYSLSGIIANRRADHIVSSLLKYVTDIDDVKGLGFCVSIEHAEFMSNYFNEHGIPSMFLTGKSPDEERNDAKNKLISGQVRFIFVIDIYNEGVDIPEVNTVLFLRPTESLTIFLQQLGRGLRLAENKECLTVLDFIGRANKRYNFEEKYAALISDTNRSVVREIKDGFISLPKGCYVQLEKKSTEYILDVIRKSIGTKDGLKARISSFTEDTGLPLNLYNFLNYYHINPRLIYSKKTTFYELCAEANNTEIQSTKLSNSASKILYRLCTIDSRKWISYLRTVIPDIESLQLDGIDDNDRIMLKMLYATIWEKPANTLGFANEIDGIIKFKNCSDLYIEFLQILDYCYDSISIVGEEQNYGYACPLEVNCTYTRSQIMAGLDFLENYTVSEGVKYLKAKNTDVFFITLNKTDKYYSPTTAYQDYSISDQLFHWQSQSTTSDLSPTGQRYISSKDNTGKVLLFVRELKSDSYGPQPFVFLGNAKYSCHTGSRPMNIVWKLDSPIPAKFINTTSKLLVI